ncbi:hypothetical protein CHL76_15950 [Marinococcus halophilus]|uniref:NERD domain-containing protein n=1 Tax=Marinococcus halophilus TaxID=1371 RepID=A0A510Y9Z4_MARHA|nr:nuclease-related domain-containing DEAD/DEAH box helicase [Marinococcus halophilus]OZT78832.1 hypothetical protein CHL76_15950 [Marinococcus halophilus]GEK60190.1 hypothetical protein MHA01_30950 [Marinococcus halophilus]
MPAEVIENFNPNDPRTNGEEYLLNIFQNSPRFDGWTIFEQPHINSAKPDFVLLHPERGIIVIEVKDWNLGLDIYENGGYIRGTNGHRHRKDPVNQVENYKKWILKSEAVNSIYLAENFHNYYGCIDTVVYFHEASKSEASKFCNDKRGYTKIWTRKDADYINESNNRLNPNDHTYPLFMNNSKFNRNGFLLRELVQELYMHLQYADYNYERRQPFILNGSQRVPLQVKPGSIRRWSGVAGSGKSLVLAEKAVNALKNDYNKRVLLLTFNITLRHYLRDLCSQQFGRGEYEGERKKLREDLTIIHFHDFLKIFMTEHEIETNIEETNENFTNKWLDAINQYLTENIKKEHFNYDYILIDEGQDFKGEWIHFLKQFFTEEGEIFIVYDKAQDLFEHGVWIEDSYQIKNIGFKGKPGNLKYTHRVPNMMVQKIHTIRQQLQIKEDEILVPEEEQLNLTESASWHNYNAKLTTEKLKQIAYHVDLLRPSNDWEDITILTTNENTGAEIVEYFEDKGVKTSHVYDLQKEKDQERRRSEKWKFQGGTGRLKISSYHSYKGWQTPNIILVLDSPSTNYENEYIFFKEPNRQAIKDALFISMSRVKGKAESGEYSFNCLNYLPAYNYLKSSFDSP